MLYRKLARFILLVCLILAVTVAACRDGGSGQAVAPEADEGNELYSTVTLSAADLGTDVEAIDVLGADIQLDDGTTVDYLSPEITAPQPFNFVIPSWRGTVPIGGEIKIRARTAVEGGAWSDWSEVELNHDLSFNTGNLVTGSIVGTPDVLQTADRVQFSAEFETQRTDGELPTLDELKVTFIDSTDGPTDEELSENRPKTNNKVLFQSSYPKPYVIPRSQWCTHPSCNYNDVDYFNVSHLVLHHTVSNNANTDWAANVRAIWTFHTFTREWGDIGYNYLIDPNGNIYEGHLGGDDVIGTHTGGGNVGTMGVAFLGTFSTVNPPAPMVDALVELLAWKTDQKEIDLWEASHIPGISWGNQHLMGHRDAFGTTACPGDMAHNILPDVRQRVSDKIDYSSEYTYIDEESRQFSRTDANWYDGPYQCGFNSHAWYTFSTTDPSISANIGTWRPQIQSSGLYQVEAYVPFCATSVADTRQAPYTINHADGSTNLTRDHDDYLGLWMPLGQYNFDAGTSGSIALGDVTRTEDGTIIWYDAIRIKPLDVAAFNRAPSEDVWLNNRSVTFEWAINLPDAISELRIQASTTATFDSVVLDQRVDGAARSLTHEFDQDYESLYWRVWLRDTSGDQVATAPTLFHIDATGPESRVTSAIQNCNGDFTIEWEGSDNLSEVASYDIFWKRPFDQTWTRLLDNTTLTSFTFTPPDDTVDYAFRSQAVDGRGNVEPEKTVGDITGEDLIPCNISPPATTGPSENSWQGREVKFSWWIDQPEAVEEFHLEAATDESFETIILTQRFDNTVFGYVHSFEQDYLNVFWRVTATATSGREFLTELSRFNMDSADPISQIDNTLETATGDILVQWSGEDEGSGIFAYTIEYKTADSDEWTPFIVDANLTEATFSPPDSDVDSYLFRSQALDVAGNREPEKPEGDFSSENGCPYIDAAPRHTLPSNDSWRSNLRVTFRWTTDTLRCITAMTFEAATDEAFTDIIQTQSFEGGTGFYSYEFPTTHAEVFWRVSQTTAFNETFTSVPTRFRFDIVKPESSVVEVKEQLDGSYQLKAAGSDTLSGIAGYIFEYREEGSDVWRRWAVGNQDEVRFIPRNIDAVYWFRSLAIDVAGNVEESAESDGDLSSKDAIPLNRVYLPFIPNQ